MVKLGLLFLISCLFLIQVEAQTTQHIKIDVRKAPLSQVLLDLKANYGLQFAFDNDLLSQFKVTVNKTFDSEAEALRFLTKKLPLEVEKSGLVYLIIPAGGIEEKPEPVFTTISGQVMESKTYEPLPFSYILINHKAVQSDRQGNFNFIASADSAYNLQISHLGYFVYDTTITQSLHKDFFLTPQIERISEVKVLSNPVEKSTLIGDRAGRIKINHQIAPILPGHGDNSVFNLLRLMPGVLAAGEQSNDLLIWGAYESHSKIQFDGFTLFGLKNFNDNISVVNPFMVKNIEVMKGGYEARYGGRVGGIVDITGKDGTHLKPTFTFNINSTTLNSMLQLPLSKKSSIMAAYRQTYYQLYDPTSLTLFNGKNTDGNANNNGAQNISPVDFTVNPDFIFRDGNLKYSYKGDKGGRFSVSLYAGGDEFLYSMEGTIMRTILTRKEEEDNQQIGGSVQYSIPWKLGQSSISVGYSAFDRKALEQNETENIRNGTHRINRNISSNNSVDELSINAEHAFNLRNGHKLVLGTGAINNKVELFRLSKDEVVIDIDNQSPRFVTYLQDELPVGKALELKSGIRIVIAPELEKTYFEPRVSASVKLSDELKFNASWGLYNQFLSKTSIVDSTYSFTYFWTNSDDRDIPVLNAEHYVAGLAFNKNGFTFSTEGYYKTTEGLNRYERGNKRRERGFYEGHAKSYGLDFYLKKEFKRHMAWLSYTLSNTKEHYPFYLREYYQPSPHHQKHELKLAGILNYKAFYVSANYIYGSGFARFDIITDDGTELNQPYKRMDAALVYKFKPGKAKAELGVSILNLLNRDNVKYSNLRVASVDDISLVGIYADAVPFTPAVFLKIEL